jgi:hypothetical protein
VEIGSMKGRRGGGGGGRRGEEVERGRVIRRRKGLKEG